MNTHLYSTPAKPLDTASSATRSPVLVDPVDTIGGGSGLADDSSTGFDLL